MGRCFSNNRCPCQLACDTVQIDVLANNGDFSNLKTYSLEEYKKTITKVMRRDWNWKMNSRIAMNKWMVMEDEDEYRFVCCDTEYTISIPYSIKKRTGYQIS